MDGGGSEVAKNKIGWKPLITYKSSVSRIIQGGNPSSVFVSAVIMASEGSGNPPPTAAPQGEKNPSEITPFLVCHFVAV